jgi:hypothetical protein
MHHLSRSTQEIRSHGQLFTRILSVYVSSSLSNIVCIRKWRNMSKQQEEETGREGYFVLPFD